MSDFLPTNEDDYNEMRFPPLHDPLGGLSANDYQRLVGGGDYEYNCPHCGERAMTGDPHQCPQEADLYSALLKISRLKPPSVYVGNLYRDLFNEAKRIANDAIAANRIANGGFEEGE